VRLTTGSNVDILSYYTTNEKTIVERLPVSSTFVMVEVVNLSLISFLRSFNFAKTSVVL